MRYALAISLILAPAVAQAQVVNTLPYLLQNGSTADATQVMANFNQIVNNVNANGAKNGINNDITNLTALTAPPSGSAALSFTNTSATGQGSANAIIITSTRPANFTLASGNSVTFVAQFSNTGATTLAVDGAAATQVYKQTLGGAAALVANDILANQSYTVFYDGIKFVLLTQIVPSPTLYMPTGAVMAFNLGSCPAGWVLSDGTNATVDVRGTTIRAVDAGRGLDPNRTLGSYQGDQVQTITGTATFNASASNTGFVSSTSSGVTAPQSGLTTNPVTFGGATFGSETRMKNTALLYCQKT